MITSTVIFSFIVGAVSGLIIVSAALWAKDLGLRMNAWKWLLVILWYLLFNFFIFLDFTLIGEGEAEAGLRMLLFQGIVMIVLGVGLVRLLWVGREKTTS